MSTTTKTASCLCGSLKLTIEGEPFRTNLCHCTSCQKLSGSIFGAFAVYKAEQVVMASAAETLRTYEDTSPESGNVLERSFCARCGSPVTGKLRTKREYTVVPVGAIDGPKDAFRPQAELFCVRRASWLGEIEGSTTFERMPTQ